MCVRACLVLQVFTNILESVKLFVISKERKRTLLGRYIVLYITNIILLIECVSLFLLYICGYLFLNLLQSGHVSEAGSD